MSDLISAMTEAGWAYDALSNGFAKGDLWVTYGQAQAALTSAETGEGFEIEPRSRTLAEVVQKASNDGVL